MGGDKAAPTTSESMGSILQAYTKYLPNLISATSKGILPMENAQLNAAQQVSPAYASLMQNIDRSNKMAAGQTDVDVLGNTGTKLATTAQGIDKVINPEFYQAKQMGIGGYNDLLKSLNPNNPNPAAERAVNMENNRSGNLNNTNAVNTTANAMAFGDKQMQRSNAFGAALGNMTGFMGASKASFDPFGRQTQSTVQNTGASGVGQSTIGMGNNLLNGATAVKTQENQINSQRRDTLDRVNETMSSIPD